jgi:hypothetical protein
MLMLLILNLLPFRILKNWESFSNRFRFESTHEQFQVKKLQYFDNENNSNYVPYVVETSRIGQNVLAVLQLH